MTNLTHFQEIAGMALDIADEEAAKVQRAWPATENDLRKSLRQWKVLTSSKIKGFELLSVCTEVWRHKPEDLSETEGREILYHPIDGNSIPEGAPLDGLSWEMLAFLRWAIQAGHVRWTDEIMIAREIKEVGGLIDNLPADRFYAKSMLPRTTDGNIDWSDVGLAQAKTVVLTGQPSPPLPSSEPMNPVYHDENSLEGILASIPALGNQNARDHLLRGLPPAPCGAISRSTATSTDLANIVRAAEGFGELSNGRMATDVIIDNAKRLVRGTALERKLEGFRIRGET